MDQQDLPVLRDSVVLRVLREQVVCLDQRDLPEQVGYLDQQDLREQVDCLDRRVLPVLAD